MYNGNVLDHLSRTYANGQFSIPGASNSNVDGFNDNNGYGISDVYRYATGNNQFINNLVSTSNNDFVRKQQRNFDNFTSQMLNGDTISQQQQRESFGTSKVNANMYDSLANEQAVAMMQNYNDTGILNTNVPAQKIITTQATVPRQKTFETNNQPIQLLTRDEYRNRQTTIIITMLIIIGFVFFMMVQLYMSQKKIEYMLNFYNQNPNRSFPFNVKNQIDKGRRYDNDEYE